MFLHVLTDVFTDVSQTFHRRRGDIHGRNSRGRLAENRGCQRLQRLQSIQGVHLSPSLSQVQRCLPKFRENLPRGQEMSGNVRKCQETSHQNHLTSYKKQYFFFCSSTCRSLMPGHLWAHGWNIARALPSHPPHRWGPRLRPFGCVRHFWSCWPKPKCCFCASWQHLGLSENVGLIFPMK